LILKRPLFVRDFLSINLNIKKVLTKKIKKMKESYRKGSDEEGREFIEKSKSDTNWFGIIGISIAVIFFIVMVSLLVRDFYKEKFQQEKDKIETVKKEPAQPSTRIITKEVIKEVPKEESQPVIIYVSDNNPTVSDQVAVAPVPAKKEKGPIAKAAENKVVKELEGE
jgi:hypothetical protein